MPITEYNRINFGLQVENLTIEGLGKVPKYVQKFIKDEGSKNWIYTLTTGWSHNTLDSALFPMKGLMTSINTEVSVPPSKIKFYTVTAQNKIFMPISQRTTVMWNAEAGYGHGYGGGQLPFYRNFFAGGVGSVRGYQGGALGPRDENGDSIGGNRRVVSNLEYFFPVPGLKNDNATRLSFFWDAGYAFGAGSKLNISELRHSTGGALTWLSPIGAIKLSFAKPFKNKPTDKLERFQFSLGTTF
jgi:outer membrane protein insertion porin family